MSTRQTYSSVRIDLRHGQAAYLRGETSRNKRRADQGRADLAARMRAATAAPDGEATREQA
jgi:hypothetical protein